MGSATLSEPCVMADDVSALGGLFAHFGALPALVEAMRRPEPSRRPTAAQVNLFATPPPTLTPPPSHQPEPCPLAPRMTPPLQ